MTQRQTDTTRMETELFAAARRRPAPELGDLWRHRLMADIRAQAARPPRESARTSLPPWLLARAAGVAASLTAGSWWACSQWLPDLDSQWAALTITNPLATRALELIWGS